MDKLQQKLGQVNLHSGVSSSKQTLPTSQKLEYREVVSKMSEMSLNGKPDRTVNVHAHEQTDSLDTPSNATEIAVNTIKSSADFGLNSTIGNGENEITDISVLERKRQERRERQRVKKQIKKEEKRLQREEEIRKKKLAPKDQKITIIDQSTMERLLSKDNNNSTTKSITHLKDEFPPIFPPLHNEKRVRAHKIRDCRRDRAAVKGNQKNSPLLADNLQISDSFERGDHSVPSVAVVNSEVSEGKEMAAAAEGTADKETKSMEEKMKGKRPKRSAPMYVQIEDILKLSTKPPETAQKYPETKINNENQLYSGNILDADKPERKRGKQRETPKKKKVSTLKSIVLQGREKRKTEREAMKKVLESEEIEEVGMGPNDVENKSEETTVKDRAQEKVNMKHGMYGEEENDDKKVVETKKNVGKDKIVDSLWSIVEIKNVNENLKTGENENVNVYENTKKETLKENKVFHDELQKGHGKDASRSPVDSKTKCLLSVDVSEVQDILKPKIHNRQFREYCDHIMTAELHKSTVALLEDVVKFQDRQFLRSPLKATAHRRHVTGLKQVQKFLTLNRCRLVVIAPDLESNNLPGGLDDKVKEIKAKAKENNIPYVFSVPRRLLGRTLKKKVPVSAVAVLNFDGTESNFQTVISALRVAQEQYQFLVRHMNVSSEPEIIKETELPAEEQQQQEQQLPPPAGDVNKLVVASLLAKLTEPKDRQSPFLKAIEQRCNRAIDCETDEEDE